MDRATSEALPPPALAGLGKLSPTGISSAAKLFTIGGWAASSDAPSADR
jgi:hypothetical protein